MASRDTSLAGAAERVSGELARERRGRVQGLRGPGRAAFVAELHRSAPRPMLLVAPDLRAAEEWVADLRFFLGDVDSGRARERLVHLLPAWDAAPFAPMSPSPETVAQRIEGLYHLSHTARAIVVTTAEAALQRVMDPQHLAESVAYVVEGQDLDLPTFATRLTDWGYKRRPLVEERGEFAVRGGLVDVFVTGFPDPLRLELMGDTIESIRTFDPHSQRKVEDREDALVLPAAEFPLHSRKDARQLARIEDRALELEMTRRARAQILDAIREGLALPGIEALAPFFVDLVPLTHHLPDETIVVLDDEDAVRAAIREAWGSVESHADMAFEERRLHAKPEDLYLPDEDLVGAFGEWPTLSLESLVTLDSEGDGARAARVAVKLPFELRATRLLREESGLAALAKRIREWTEADARTALVVGTASQAERLVNVLEQQDVHVSAHGDSLPDALAERTAPGPFIVLGELTDSIELPEDGLVCIAESHLFGEHRHGTRRRATAMSLDQVMKSLAELKPDDFVVHLDHGIGLYRGLTHLSAGGSEGDYLLLEYHGADRLYVPVDKVGLVQKYVGGEGASPTLDKLGAVTWEKSKKKAKESILAMAHELLSLYATRQRNEGHRFPAGDPLVQEFEARFPFDETPDQQRAIDDVMADLAGTKPMDRLVCGDVGYGKTEVAMRAAFLCAMEGQQVAVLVPTTVLAQQHYEGFKKRFEGYPIEIEMLSSFRTRKENQAVGEGLRLGKVDVVIGTHRLLSSDIEFAKLGLLVIDEEHRFGVRDKERIKQIRKLVDVLTLTATPIPRTLELSLTGIRDLSVIETPPLDRQAIRTYVTRMDDHVVRDALVRELRRGGQAFFVHNRVQSIDRIAQKIHQLVPEARIEIGHGQMKERQLEKVMLGFLNHDFDVLVCTAIIESGLDIPNANTILINRADTFGLAQLYQLRGRVGRSPARAYAYLLIPGEQILTDDAKKRLQVLQELDDLGGGFKIAAHDLEIRGAGNLLGKQQSGHITSVGFELYTKMMEDAVSELRGEEVQDDIEPEVQLGVPAYVPDSYVEDVNQRLVLYKRLATLSSSEAAQQLGEELRDRFGPVPQLVERLLEIMDLRRRMKDLRLVEAKIRGSRMLLRPHGTSPLDPGALVGLVEEGDGRYSLSPDGGLGMQLSAAQPSRIDALADFLSVLEGIAGMGVDPG